MTSILDSSVLAFAAVAFILTITPGADTMLVVRSVMAGGQRAGILATAGINLGLFVHAMISGIGLSIILVESATAFQVVKMCGAIYLVYLGIDSIRAATGAGSEAPAIGSVTPLPRIRRSFAEGVLSNVLNPKVAIFYLAFLPQFIRPGDNVLAKSLTLAGIHALMGIGWLLFVTMLFGRIRTSLSSGVLKRRLEMIGGVILVGLGIRLALERR